MYSGKSMLITGFLYSLYFGELVFNITLNSTFLLLITVESLLGLILNDASDVGSFNSNSPSMFLFTISSLLKVAIQLLLNLSFSIFLIVSTS